MSKKALVMALVAGLAFAAGCKSEIDDKEAAKVSEPAVAEEKAEDEKADEGAAKQDEAAQARVVDISVEDSSIDWVGSKVTLDHDGGFKKWSGQLTEKGGKVEKLEFTVDTTSVWSDTDRLTGHLKSGDFFDVEKFPEAKFVSTNIAEKETKTKDGKTFTHEVTGNFTIRDVTKGVTFPATIKVDDKKVEANSEFTINRFDFGIEYKGKPDDLIRKEVLMKIKLVAPLDAAAKDKVAKEAAADKAAE